MDYIDTFASLGAGAEAEDDAQAEMDAYEAGTLGICSELEGAAGVAPDDDLVQQHIAELSEAVVNTNTAKSYARYSHGTYIFCCDRS